jgi:hypothetical protein
MYKKVRKPKRFSHFFIIQIVRKEAARLILSFYITKEKPRQIKGLLTAWSLALNI